jgi:hypothetical protein
MSEISVVLAEIQKNLGIASKIRAFLESTETNELSKIGKTPATALMLQYRKMLQVEILGRDYSREVQDLDHILPENVELLELCLDFKGFYIVRNFGKVLLNLVLQYDFLKTTSKNPPPCTPPSPA